MKRNCPVIRLVAILLTVLLAAALSGCAPRKPAQPDITFPTPPARDGTLWFHPAAASLPAQDPYEFPYMGMTAVFSDTLLALLDSGDGVLLPSADYRPNGTFDYAALCWYAVEENQKNRDGKDVNEWVKELDLIGILGVYKAEANLDLNVLTDCAEHRELGKSPDGAYRYVLSLSDAAGAEKKDALAETEITISEMLKMDVSNGVNAFSEARVEVANIGELQIRDVDGTVYTTDLFREYDLTLVNVFTTWCPACIDEMPDLEKLKQEMASQGVNVVGVVFEAVNETGETQEQVVELVKVLRERAGLTFPLLIPDETDMNGRLKGLSAFPESFFIDSEGNIVGEPIMGAKSLESWLDLTAQALDQVKNP